MEKVSHHSPLEGHMQVGGVGGYGKEVEAWPATGGVTTCWGGGGPLPTHTEEAWAMAGEVLGAFCLGCGLPCLIPCFLTTTWHADHKHILYYSVVTGEDGIIMPTMKRQEETGVVHWRNTPPTTTPPFFPTPTSTCSAGWNLLHLGEQLFAPGDLPTTLL